MSDDEDMRRRRALYRASHRGTKEMDVLLGRFADANIAHFSGETLSHFESFLDLPDPKLQGWFFTPASIDRSEFRDLVIDLRRFHGLDGAADPKRT